MKTRRAIVALIAALTIAMTMFAFNRGWLVLGGAERPPVGQVRPADLAPALIEPSKTTVAKPTVTSTTLASTTLDNASSVPGTTVDEHRDGDHDGDDD